jgi:hypothetical protein
MSESLEQIARRIARELNLVWYEGSQSECGILEQEVAMFAGALVEELDKQEPVAWRQIDGNATRLTTYIADKAGTWEPLFTHPAPIPEGYALVPSEPTEAMIAAGNRVMGGSGRWTTLYKAMLAAAQGETP